MSLVRIVYSKVPAVRRSELNAQKSKSNMAMPSAVGFCDGRSDLGLICVM